MCIEGTFQSKTIHRGRYVTTVNLSSQRVNLHVRVLLVLNAYTYIHRRKDIYWCDIFPVLRVTTYIQQH